MCGRFLFDGDIEDLLERFNIGDSLELNIERRPEVFPTDTVPVLTHQEYNQMELMKWGFTGISKNGVIINARSETAIEKPLFKRLLLTRRCLIPANAFFEWKDMGGKKKQKFIISMKDEPFFTMAGLYNQFTGERGELMKSFVIMTTAPNDVMSEIHDRMPVILDRAGEEIWLKSADDHPKEIQVLFKPVENHRIKIVPCQENK